MHIDSSSQVPVFKQIASYLRGGIAAGVYRVDEALPSKRTLAMKLSVNPLTVQHAYAQLEAEGLVYVRKGVGMFVAKRAASTARKQSEEVCYQQLVDAFRTAHDANLSEKQLDSLVKKARVKTEEEHRQRS